MIADCAAKGAVDGCVHRARCQADCIIRCLDPTGIGAVEIRRKGTACDRNRVALGTRQVLRIIVRIGRGQAVGHDGHIIHWFGTNGEDNGLSVLALGKIIACLGKAAVRQGAYGSRLEACQATSICQQCNHRAVRIACQVCNAGFNSRVRDVRSTCDGKHRSVFRGLSRLRNVEIDILEIADICYGISQGIDVQRITAKAGARTAAPVEAGAGYVRAIQVDDIAAHRAVFCVAAVDSPGNFAVQEVQRIVLDDTVGVANAIRTVDAASDGTAVYGNCIVRCRIGLSAVDCAAYRAAGYAYCVKAGHTCAVIGVDISCNGRSIRAAGTESDRIVIAACAAGRAVD